MDLVTIIGAVIGLVIGTALVRYLHRTWWGRHLFAAGDWQNDSEEHGYKPGFYWDQVEAMRHGAYTKESGENKDDNGPGYYW